MREMARALSVSLGTVANLEAGRVEVPHPATRAALAQLELEAATEEANERGSAARAAARGPGARYRISTRPLPGADGVTLWETWAYELGGPPDPDAFVIALGQGIGLTPDLAYWAAMRALRANRRSVAAPPLATPKPS